MFTSMSVEFAQQAAVFFLTITLVIVFFFLSTGIERRPRRRFRSVFRPVRFDQRHPPDRADIGQQLHAVMANSFEKRRILSPSEYRVFAIIEGEVASQRKGYRVFAQTSLGEILRSSNSEAFHSINSKRVDILVVDRGGWPFLAVEYQGDGHYQGTAAGRDAVKKEAFRKAGVPYLEFCATDTEDKIRSRLREHLVSKAAVTSHHGPILAYSSK
jgi:hypothetical protein